VLGPVVNGAGYGLLSPLAGWAVVDVAPNPRTGAVWALCLLGVLASYFAAQAFQGPEDAARGYRTLVVTHGSAACVGATRWCLRGAFAVSVVLAVMGWFPRVCLAAAPLGLWVDAYLGRWQVQPDGGGERWARGMAARLLTAGLVLVGLVALDHQLALWGGGPVAGLATATGHPSDRPRLSPAGMRQWERYVEAVPETPTQELPP
jgi:4-hydroxybenzoate polyprenyltransferase